MQDFNFQADSSERVGILAPSGFGKTTLCQLLAGYLKADSGEILLDGKPLPTKGYCPVQMIWQHPERVVNPRLRMKEVLAEGQDIPEHIITGLGIETDWLNRFPGEISGGEMQRFCIARALGRDTKFILADEISTMLDLITQSQIWNFLLSEVKERGIGLIAVTHSQPLMDLVATRTVEL
ncbi:MAG: ATP-binding cassette domain-containing protein [Bacillota bacterium]|nr:ATP-binding cassette domain-containing protein [Bacillota bacterium]